MFIERHREFEFFCYYVNKKRVPERYGWWQKKLASLGIVVKKGNELNDVKELRDLTENIKQTFIQDYKELLQQ